MNKPQEYTFGLGKYVLASAYDQLEAELEKIDNENCKLLKEQFDLKNTIAELEAELAEAMAENKRLREKINAMDVAGETLVTIVEAMHGNCDSVESWENACNISTQQAEGGGE